MLNTVLALWLAASLIAQSAFGSVCLCCLLRGASCAAQNAAPLRRACCEKASAAKGSGRACCRAEKQGPLQRASELDELKTAAAEHVTCACPKGSAVRTSPNLAERHQAEQLLKALPATSDFRVGQLAFVEHRGAPPLDRDYGPTLSGYEICLRFERLLN